MKCFFAACIVLYLHFPLMCVLCENRWPHSPPPNVSGVQVLKAVPLETLVPFIDWNGLFFACAIPGRYPQILEGDTPKAEAARKLFTDAESFLNRIVSDKLIEARAVFGIFPVKRNGEEIVLFAETSQVKIEFLRQQQAENNGTLKSLADYLSPHEIDFMGLFALSVGFGVKEAADLFRRSGDDYSAMLLHFLAGRLTEAFSEKLHRDVMFSYWGYVLPFHKPFGIRPAPGYPACRDHTEKLPIWEALQVKERIGLELSDSFMMIPENAICGYYLAHPKSVYFSVGPIGEDQLVDYANRKGWSLETARKWVGC